MKTSLFLVGYMGAGKTTIGRRVAQLLCLPFFDLDREIELRQNRPISLIFDEAGEDFFRQCEYQVLQSLPGIAVVALGGGAYIQKPVRALVRRQGVSLFLDWPFEVLYSRVFGDRKRPLAKETVRMKAMFESRLPIYRKADLIWTSRFPHERSIEQISQEIVQRLLK